MLRAVRKAANETNDPMLLNRFQAAEGEFTNAGAKVANVFEDLAESLPARGAASANRLSRVQDVVEYMVAKGRLALAKDNPDMPWVMGASKAGDEATIANLRAKNPDIESDVATIGERLGKFADDVGDSKLARSFREGYMFKPASEGKTKALTDAEGNISDRIRGAGIGRTKEAESLTAADPLVHLQKQLLNMAQSSAGNKISRLLGDATLNSPYAISVKDTPEVAAEKLRKYVEESKAQAVTRESQLEDVVDRNAWDLTSKNKRKLAQAFVKRERANRELRRSRAARGEVVTKREESLLKAETPEEIAKRSVAVERARRAQEKAKASIERHHERKAKEAYAKELSKRASDSLESWVRKRAEYLKVEPTPANLDKIRKRDFDSTLKLTDSSGNPAYIISRPGFTDLYSANKAWADSQAIKFLDSLRKFQQGAVFTLASGIAPIVSAGYNAQTHFFRLGPKATIEMAADIVPIALSQFKAMFGKDWKAYTQAVRERGMAHDPYAGKSSDMESTKYRAWAGEVDRVFDDLVNGKAITPAATAKALASLSWLVVKSPFTAAKALNKLLRPLTPWINEAAAKTIYRRKVNEYKRVFGQNPSEGDKAVLRASSDLEATRHMDESRTMQDSFKAASTLRNSVANIVTALNHIMPFARPQFMDLISTLADAKQDKKRLAGLFAMMGASSAWYMLNTSGEDESKLTAAQRIQGSYQVTDDNKVVRNPFAVTGTFGQIARGSTMAFMAMANNKPEDAARYLYETSLSVVPAAKMSENLVGALDNPFSGDNGYKIGNAILSAFVPTVGSSVREFNKSKPSTKDRGVYEGAYDEGVNKGRVVNALGALVGLKNTLPGDIYNTAVTQTPQGRFESGIAGVVPKRDIQIEGLIRTQDITSQLANAGEQIATIRRRAVKANPRISPADVEREVNRQWKANNESLFKQQIPQAAYTIVARAYDLPSDPRAWKPKTEKDAKAQVHIDRLINQFTKAAAGASN